MDCSGHSGQSSRNEIETEVCAQTRYGGLRMPKVVHRVHGVPKSSVRMECGQKIFAQNFRQRASAPMGAWGKPRENSGLPCGNSGVTPWKSGRNPSVQVAT